MNERTPTEADLRRLANQEDAAGNHDRANALHCLIVCGCAAGTTPCRGCAMAEQTAPQHDPTAVTHNASRCHVCIGERAYRKGFNEGVRRLDNLRREQRETATIAPTPERGDVDALLRLLPLDSTGHVTACGWEDAAEHPTCGCYDLPSRIADVLADRLAAVQAERDAAQSEAVEWSIKAGRLSAQRDDLRAALDRVKALDFAALLAAHRSVFQSDGDYGEMQWVECACGSDYYVDTEAGYAEHEVHLAAVLRAAVEGGRS